MAAKERKTKEPSSGERTFMYYWNLLAGEALPFQREFKFHPERGWLFDFVWEAKKVAVEVEGGTGSGGRHTRFLGFQEDCEKYNAAALLGWRLLRFTPQMLEADPETCIDMVIQLLGGRRVYAMASEHHLCHCPTFTGEYVLNCEVCGGFKF